MNIWRNHFREGGGDHSCDRLRRVRAKEDVNYAARLWIKPTIRDFMVIKPKLKHLHHDSARTDSGITLKISQQ